jgi:hypothetical protein
MSQLYLPLIALDTPRGKGRSIDLFGLRGLYTEPRSLSCEPGSRKLETECFYFFNANCCVETQNKEREGLRGKRNSVSHKEDIVEIRRPGRQHGKSAMLLMARGIVIYKFIYVSTHVG